MQEMQAKINYYFVEILEGIERQDWHLFGKIRTAQHERFNTPLIKKPSRK